MPKYKILNIDGVTVIEGDFSDWYKIFKKETVIEIINEMNKILIGE